MKCIQCKGEFDAIRTTAKFCSDKCRVSNSRLSVTDSVTNLSVTDDKKVSVTLNEITVSLSEVCTPDELSKFPNMCETIKRYKESIYRLENNPINLLREKGIFIPAKYAVS